MVSIIDSNLYDAEATINHVQNLAFHRSSETVGESKGIFYIQEALKNRNVDSKVEYFSYAGAKTYLTRIIFLIIFGYLLLSRLIVILIICLAIRFFLPTERSLSLVKKEKSKNLITTIPCKNNKEKRPVIIFSAHYDTFSANLPYKIQTVLIFLFRIMFIPYLVMAVFYSVWFVIDFLSGIGAGNALISLIVYTSIIQIFVLIIMLLLIYNNKKSLGSIDNASGVSILIEITKILKKNPLKNIDVIFIWTGAEEWGLLGSRNYVKEHINNLNEEYDLNKSFNINIDMVGTYIGLLDKSGLFKNRIINDSLNEEFETSAKNLNIPMIRYSRRISPKTDHRSFLSLAKKSKSKFQVACFHSDKDSQYIHSSKDTPEKCSSPILNGCLEICYFTIKRIDTYFD
ncbi:MAG: M28 family metallopeptidase [Candidatus Hodarchaeota archaeon]